VIPNSEIGSAPFDARRKSKHWRMPDAAPQMQFAAIKS